MLQLCSEMRRDTAACSIPKALRVSDKIIKRAQSTGRFNRSIVLTVENTGIE